MVNVDEVAAAELPTPRRCMVVADDGVPIAVREYGRSGAQLTVVFLHGHCLHAEYWVYLCRYLAPQWGEDVRIISYDHRGHGSSGSAGQDSCTLEQLGDDLDAVLRTVAPTGPVVLIGHSMGAMAALAYLRARPHTIGTRVAGIGLVALAAAMLNDTSIVTMAAFLGAFIDLDESDTVRLLSNVPVLVLVGSADLVTPPEHSRSIATALPQADFVCVEGAGHGVILEDPAGVAASVVRLVDRARAARMLVVAG